MAHLEQTFEQLRMMARTFCDSIFSEFCVQIENEYRSLGYDKGWRFLASRRSTFAPDTRIALITMNPGGSEERTDHGRESSEEGSAYVVESWRGCSAGEAPLQKQVRHLFGMLAGEPGRGAAGDDLLSKSLAAYFVPFRSPTFQKLPHRDQALAFASTLWDHIFKYIDPILIITIDRGTALRLTTILRNKHGRESMRQEFETGWGAYNAELILFDAGGGTRAIVGLPHLSRFGIFGRRRSEPSVQRIIDALLISFDGVGPACLG